MNFRSDTVTKPCLGMRQAMAEAVVGDDVFGDDPTVIELQNTVAKLLNKEAGLFVPTGKQCRQWCLKWKFLAFMVKDTFQQTRNSYSVLPSCRYNGKLDLRYESLLGTRR